MPNFEATQEVFYDLFGDKIKEILISLLSEDEGVVKEELNKFVEDYTQQIVNVFVHYVCDDDSPEEPVEVEKPEEQIAEEQEQQTVEVATDSISVPASDSSQPSSEENPNIRLFNQALEEGTNE